MLETGMRPGRSELCAACLAASVLVGTSARADCCWPTIREPEDDYSVGPSLAWARIDGRSELLSGLDFTYLTTVDWFPTEFVWASVGVRGAASPTVVLPYVEVGTLLFLPVVGVGYSAEFRSEPMTHYAHLFLGLPLYPQPVIEPYYRPAFRVAGTDAPTIHEVGLLLKLTTYVL